MALVLEWSLSRCQCLGACVLCCVERAAVTSIEIGVLR